MVRHGPPPCRECPKVPAEALCPSPAHSIELDERGQQAYDFYLECKAVNQWPDDYAVRRIAKVIRQVEDLSERFLTERRHSKMTAALITAAVTHGLPKDKPRIPLGMTRR